MSFINNDLDSSSMSMTGSSILSPSGDGRNNTMQADVGRHGQRRRKRNFGGTGHRTGGKTGSSTADRVYAHLSHVGGTTFNPNIDNSLDSRARSIMADNQFLDRASKLPTKGEWSAPKALFVQDPATKTPRANGTCCICCTVDSRAQE